MADRHSVDAVSSGNYYAGRLRLSSIPMISRTISHYQIARLGQNADARHTLDHLIAAAKQSYVPAYYFVYAGLGDKDRAFKALNQADDERFARFAYLRQEAVWDSLHDDPRYSKLLGPEGFSQN